MNEEIKQVENTENNMYLVCVLLIVIASVLMCLIVLVQNSKGGGHKRKFRIIDFKRNKDGVPAVVKTIEYDPNRSARIALLF